MERSTALAQAKGRMVGGLYRNKYGIDGAGRDHRGPHWYSRGVWEGDGGAVPGHLRQRVGGSCRYALYLWGVRIGS